MHAMTNRVGVAYLSDASRDLLPVGLDAILLDARVFNASVGITGALFHGDGCFSQSLKGTEATVQTTFDRLSRASAHRNLRTLFAGPFPARCFESWHMGLFQAPETAIQALSQASWEEAIPDTRPDSLQSGGWGLFTHF